LSCQNQTRRAEITWKRIKAEGATDILSRSRKVLTQIPNKTNFVTAHDDGEKRPTAMQGRAGAGLASPAGTGAGAAPMVVD